MIDVSQNGFWLNILAKVFRVKTQKNKNIKKRKSVLLRLWLLWCGVYSVADEMTSGWLTAAGVW